MSYLSFCAVARVLFGLMQNSEDHRMPPDVQAAARLNPMRQAVSELIS